MKGRLSILVVFDSAGAPPDDQDFSEEFNKEDWFTEAAVVETLQNLGHRVRTLGIYDDISLLINAVNEDPPDIVFNLTELFMGNAHMDKSIPIMLEMLDIYYTGCSADGMIICNNKALSKKILTYHRMKVPEFHTFRKGNRVWVPRKLNFPAVVKPLREEASTGISQSSFVENEIQFKERVNFVHQKLNRHAIVEQYIAGRELYVSILGNRRLWAFPPREMVFGKVPNSEPKIATYYAKWDEKYRKKWGIRNDFATNIPEPVERKILRTCKRAYRALGIDGYARFDCRLTPDNELYIIEANANPELAIGDEFAESAARSGFPFEKLLMKIIRLGFDRE